MDLAIVTTTINVPHVLRDYRRECPDALIIVAGDQQTPHDEVLELCAEIGNALYMGPDMQQAQYAKVSDAIGWRCIQRRNLGMLEALRQGADLVMLLDDDNIPSENYGQRVTSWFDGADIRPIQTVIWNHRWFNIGQYADVQYYARGYPCTLRKPVTDRWVENHQTIRETVNVGVFTSLIYGDPDISAVERMELAPMVKRYGLPGGASAIGIHPKHTWGPINSQATVVRRELVPLFGLPPGLGRYDDIVAGYVAQRVMGEHGYHVVYGAPHVTQERNPHNLIADLEAELWGMKHTEDVVAFLEGVPLGGNSISDDMYTIVDEFSQQDAFPWPVQAQGFYDAWIEEVERIG